MTLKDSFNLTTTNKGITMKSTKLAIATILTIATASATAKISSDEIARLGQDLTPLGAEQAGNVEGTIPGWTGGILTPPVGYKVGDHHPDPYASDQPLFVIHAGNIDEYRDKVSVGHQRMLELYPKFQLLIYPTRRSASAPQRIYEATRRIAATAKLVSNGNGVVGATVGIPFPIPSNGLEVIWNHLLRYRGEAGERTIGQAAVTRSGDYTLVKFKDYYIMHYSKLGMTEEQLDNKILLFRQHVVAPAQLAGRILLIHDTLNQVTGPRSAWTYEPGQRRVKRAPHVGYDSPGTVSDGLRTNDQFDMFNGAPDRYNWQLVGKKEMYVPYNSYKLHSDKITFADILTPLHINPEHLRYELHRVWVVEATLKAGERHIYKRRRFYVDEDSWNILLVDIYDNKDRLWRVSEGHPINYYEKSIFSTTLEVHMDFQLNRYLALGLNNEFPMVNFDVNLTFKDFTPAALRRKGKR